jgi:hypothetical protein
MTIKRIFIFFLLFVYFSSHAQVYDKDTLQWQGNSKDFINLVIMGDGYTREEQDKFIVDASNIADYFFTQSPFDQYKPYFNIIAIKAISDQSGIKHPNTASDCNNASPRVPVTSPSTLFNTTFDYAGIHRLVVPQNTARIASVLASNFPGYDQVMIMANSTFYGGSGGSNATSTIHTLSAEVAMHEIGHSFATLSDEYYAGDQYVGEKANMSADKDPLYVKWRKWLNTKSVGIYQHCCGGQSSKWYKPHENCKMKVLGPEYCPVCKEAIIDRIHTLTNAIIRYSPIEKNITAESASIKFSLDKLIKPRTNTLKIKWVLNDVAFANNKESIELTQSMLNPNTNKLSVIVEDTTTLSRDPNHTSKHAETIIWTITNLSTGLDIISNKNEVLISISPLPFDDILHIKYTLAKSGNGSASIFNEMGQHTATLFENKYLNTEEKIETDLSNFTPGIYFLKTIIDDVVYTQEIIKI